MIYSYFLQVIVFCVVMRFSGTGVVSSQPNKNGQAYATDFLKVWLFFSIGFCSSYVSSLFDIVPCLELIHFFLQASHRDKNNSSYNNYQDSNLHGDRAVRSYCWSQTSVSSPGNLNVYGQLPSFTQSHAFRPTFKVLTRIYFYSFCTFYPDNLRLKALLFMSSEGKTSLRTVYKTCQSKDKLCPI